MGDRCIDFHCLQWPHTENLFVVTLWLICGKCDIWDDSASDQMTGFYLSTTQPHLDVPICHDCAGWRLFLIFSFFSGYKTGIIILHQFGYLISSWTQLRFSLIKSDNFTRCTIQIQILFVITNKEINEQTNK